MQSTPTLEEVQAKSGAAPRPAAQGAMTAIVLSVITGTAAEICVKVGAAETASHTLLLPWLGLSGLESKWVWFGIVLTILSFLAWVRALRVIPLGMAFSFSNVIHVTVPLSCWLILGEAIGLRRWLGIGLVISGLVIIARPFARLDKKLEETL
jgi:undecaprenyl phosphate-alpha-L-ara4N flippase subunit ArnF